MASPVHSVNRVNLIIHDLAPSSDIGLKKAAVRIKKPFSDIEIDYMREQDLQIVVEIERQSFSDPWCMATFQEGISQRNPHSHFLVVRRNSAPIAYVNYWLVIDDVHIANFAVSPAYRRIGMGKYLLAKSLKHIRDTGGKQVFLEVRVSNIPAQNLYRQLGFRLLHIRKRYYQNNGEDAYIFHIDNLSEIDL